MDHTKSWTLIIGILVIIAIPAILMVVVMYKFVFVQ